MHYVACSPLQDLSLGRLDCTPDPIFFPTTYTLQDLEDLMPAQVLDQARLVAQQLPPGLLAPLEGLEIVMKPIAIHAMVLAVFASLVAPFGELACCRAAATVQAQPAMIGNVPAAQRQRDADPTGFSVGL
jgi:hypothetical protein